MAYRFGRHRSLRFVLLATVVFFGVVGLALLACGGHAFYGTHTSTDVRAAAEESDTQRLDVGARVTETPPDDTSPAVVDSSRPPCSIVTGKYGACDTVLGWGFDGKVCRQWTGCDCASDCAQMFPSAQGCAQVCRKQGNCNSEALVSRGVATFAIGGSCDSLLACVPPGLEGELGLELAGSCQPGGTCAGLQTCPLKVPGVIDQTLWDGYCTASLISGVRIECFQRLL